MSHLVNKITYPLNLGNQLENGVTTLEFDISAWVSAYPTIVCAITALCDDVDDPFLVSGVSQSEGTLAWVVGNDVTQYDGNYTIVIRGLVDDTEKRSAVINAAVAAGHAAPGSTPSDISDYLSEATLAESGRAAAELVREEIIAAVDGMTVEATQLAEGEAPTAVISEVNDVKHIAFGIPKGDTGEKGDKGDKGDPGEDASVPLEFTGKTVAVGDWSDSGDGSDYPYVASIPCEGVLATMEADVYFAKADAESGNYSGYADCGDGVVNIYAAEIPGDAIIIPTIKAV